MNDNKKRINNEQELLELFCDPYSIHTELQKPYYEKQSKTVYSFNGRAAILINPSVTTLSYEEIVCPFIGSLIKGAAEGCFTFESLEKVLESFYMEAEKVITEEGRECEECEGSGYVEWEYTDLDGEIHFHDDDCPICKGDGIIEAVLKSTGFMIPADNSFVRIGDSFFRGIQAQMLLWAMEYFNVDKATFSEVDNIISFDLKNGVQIAVGRLDPYGAFQNIVTLETTKL